jgi:hypothetical protein
VTHFRLCAAVAARIEVTRGRQAVANHVVSDRMDEGFAQMPDGASKALVGCDMTPPASPLAAMPSLGRDEMHCELHRTIAAEVHNPPTHHPPYQAMASHSRPCKHMHPSAVARFSFTTRAAYSCGRWPARRRQHLTERPGGRIVLARGVGLPENAQPHLAII